MTESEIKYMRDRFLNWTLDKPCWCGTRIGEHTTQCRRNTKALTKAAGISPRHAPANDKATSQPSPPDGESSAK